MQIELSLQDFPIKETSKFDNDKKEAQALLHQLKGTESNDAKPKSVLSGMNQYKQVQKSGQPEMDWFNFETRIRKVIYDVIEPLTKKQFQTFDCIDDMKKQILEMGFRNDATLQQVDRVIRRNEAFDKLDKYTHEIVNHIDLIPLQEQEMLTIKALQKSDIQNMLEKMETWGSRWKVTQNEVNNFHRFDDKITKVQKLMQDISEQYKQTVSKKFKEMQLDFFKQNQTTEKNHRELKQDMQEVLVKVQSVKEFTQGSDLKFQHLNSMIDELRESIENSRFTHTYGKQQADEVKLREHISHVQDELQLIRKDNLQIDTLMRPLKVLDEKDVENIAIRCQMEMFENVFGQNVALKKVSEYQSLTINNYLDWRTVQISKYSEENSKDDLEDQEDDVKPKKKQPFWKIYSLNQRQSNSDLNRKFSVSKQSMVSSPSSIKKASARNIIQAALRKSSILQPSEISVINEQIEKQNDLYTSQDFQITDKTGKRSSIQQINVQDLQNHQDATKLNLLQGAEISKDLTARLSHQNLNNEPTLSSSQIRNSQQNDIIQENEDQDQVNYQEEEGDDESFDEDDFNLILKKLVVHPAYISQDVITELVETKTFQLDQKIQEQLIEIIEKFEIKFNQDKLYDNLSLLKNQIDSVSKDMKSLKNNEQTQQLQLLISRTDANITFAKNDLQQQIYKLKEFDEQIYIKQIEQKEKVDLEVIKIKRERSDQQIAIDKIAKDFQALKIEDTQLQEMIVNNSELLEAIVKTQIIKIAMDQQDEIDRKTNQLYQPSSVGFLGQSFSRQHLIHCMRVLLESEWQSMIYKKPYSKMHNNNSITFFNSVLSSKMTQLSMEYQKNIDQINLELERQQRGLPREIVKIKEALDTKPSRSLRKTDQVNTSRDFLNMTADNSDLAEYGLIDQPVKYHNKLNKAKNQMIFQNIHKSVSPNNQSQMKTDGSKEKLNNLNIMPEIRINRNSRNLMQSSTNDLFDSSQSPFSNVKVNQRQQQDVSNFRSNSQLKQQPVIQTNVNKSFNLDLPKQKLPIKGSLLLGKQAHTSKIHISQHQISLNQSITKTQKQLVASEMKEEESLMLMPIKNNQTQKLNMDYNYNMREDLKIIAKKNQALKLNNNKRF